MQLPKPIATASRSLALSRQSPSAIRRAHRHSLAAPHQLHLPLRPSSLSSLRLSAPTTPTTTPKATLYREFSTAKMAPIPAIMKAVQIAKNGGPEVLEYKSIPVPTLSPGHILVKNQFAGINYIDTYFRSGLYPAPFLPLTMGREASGEVLAVHDSVTGFAPGTRVAYMAGGEAATYAEYTAVEASKVVIIPEGLSSEEAAAIYLQGLTAWTFIREAGEVKPGQWTLVHAAAGGVGTLLVQMLKSVGAKIIATASTDEKLALAKGYGADYLVNSNDDIVSKVKEITGGHGVDAIFDGVGKATFDADLQMIALKGHLISFGNASGAVPPVNILQLGPKNVKLMRPIVNGYVTERADLERYTSELFDLVISKKIEVKIHNIYPLKDAAQAHIDLESRKTTGKLLLKIE
ncbi:hypothetical protein V8C35DRAFT_302178 [Trichoderma chlorosporum]